MKWNQAKSIDELKQLGKLKDVAEGIANELNGADVPKTSWTKLWDFVQVHKPPKKAKKKKFAWQTVKTVEDLKALGSFKDVRAQIAMDIAPNTVGAKSWIALFEFATTYKGK